MRLFRRKNREDILQYQSRRKRLSDCPRRQRKEVMKNGSFQSGAKYGIYRYEQPPFTQQGIDLKGKRLAFANAVLARRLGLYPWGNAEDIKPYIDPDFQNNIILTQTERLTIESRPKQPKYARNKNVVVIGGSGSGKTRFFVKPNLMQLHSSYCLTDPKGLIS